jgi:hypothetical protein
MSCRDRRENIFLDDIGRLLRIPGQIGQRFQFNPDSDSNSIRTGNPIQTGQ